MWFFAGKYGLLFNYKSGTLEDIWNDKIGQRFSVEIKALSFTGNYYRNTYWY